MFLVLSDLMDNLGNGELSTPLNLLVNDDLVIVINSLKMFLTSVCYRKFLKPCSARVEQHSLHCHIYYTDILVAAWHGHFYSRLFCNNHCTE